jgi:hypothetical protein
MTDTTIRFQFFRFRRHKKDEETMAEIRETREMARAQVDGIYSRLDSEDKWFVDQSHGEKAPRCTCDDAEK